jgi:hypothetical protein
VHYFWDNPRRNIPDKLLQAVVDIYRRNKISVKLNSECSEKVDIEKGVQECIKDTHYHQLYSIYTHTHT